MIHTLTYNNIHILETFQWQTLNSKEHYLACHPQLVIDDWSNENLSCVSLEKYEFTGKSIGRYILVLNIDLIYENIS